MSESLPIETLPLVCTLLPDELRERRNSLLARVGAAIEETQERENGYAYRFPAGMLNELAQVMGLERQCCSFLRFVLTAEPRNGALWLEVTGPDGTKAFLDEFWSDVS